MDLSTIYADGVTVVHSSPTYDPSQPIKSWIRPLQPGDSPEDDYVYQYPSVDNSLPPNYIRWHTTVISKGAAAVANVETPQPPGTVVNSISVPIPADESKIPVGYQLVGTPFGIIITQIAVAPASSSSQDRILEGIQSLLRDRGLPPV